MKNRIETRIIMPSGEEQVLPGMADARMLLQIDHIPLWTCKACDTDPGRSGQHLRNDPREKQCGQRARTESRESSDVEWSPALLPLASCKISCSSSYLSTKRGCYSCRLSQSAAVRTEWNQTGRKYSVDCEPPDHCRRLFLFF